MTRNILFIVNPVSGSGSGRRLPDLLRHIPAYAAITYEVRFTSCTGHAAAIATAATHNRQFSHIIAVGGDGTVNEVGSALIGSDVPLGIIPLGSGNGLARHLGISRCVDRALLQILDSVETPIDVLNVNGRYSLNAVGFGFDAEVARIFAGMNTRGFLAYAIATARSWFHYTDRHYTFHVGDCTWEEDRCLIVTLANGSQYGYNFRIVPSASLLDGQAELCIIKRPAFHQLPCCIYRALTHGLHSLPGVSVIPCNEVTITGDFAIGHLDGEPCRFESPVRAHVIPGALRMLVPYSTAHM